MVIAAVVSVLGLAAVLLAVYRDEPLEEPGPARPDWDPLPSPAEVAHGEFPLAFPGYNPASVEVHFDLLRRAYEDLYASAPPEVLATARRRARARAGLADTEPDARPRGASAWEPPPQGEDALRMEAVFASVDPAARGDAEPITDAPEGKRP